MIINEKTSKIYKFRVFTSYIFSLKFVGTVFVSSLFELASASEFIISSHVINESSIIFHFFNYM